MEQGKNIATDTTEPLKEAEPVIEAENKVKKKKEKETFQGWLLVISV